MTNKTEDRFYFGKPGQPERFGNIDDWNTATIKLKKLQQEIVVLMNEAVNTSNSALSKKIAYPYRDIISTLDAVNPKIKAMQEVIGHLNNLHGRIGFSRPGQPERFQIGGSNSRAIQTVVSAIEKAISLLSQLPGDQSIKGPIAKIMQQLFAAQESARAISRGQFSRAGQPDKFDASSLDRGDFADASKSPMLGKLLSAKVMPEGGWRAVQVGSDTLVISFEDADLARDFGRRASTKGYSATSPVATTGRYWNVEVKNDGK